MAQQRQKGVVALVGAGGIGVAIARRVAQGGCEAQLRGHTAANVQCGNTREFLIQVVSNNVPFIGYPHSLNALAVIEEVTGNKQ